MTVTNTSGGGNGIFMRSAKVELIDVALKGCAFAALYITNVFSETTVVATRCEFANSGHIYTDGYGAVVQGSLTSATFKNCVFHDNSSDGIFVSQSAIHLHGAATAIHSNERHGLAAWSSAKVIIHLPSHHNTVYNNEGEDRKTVGGGTITNVEDKVKH